MNEYELMLFALATALPVVWWFFHCLARMVVWSRRPRLDTMRYALITVCLATEIGEAFEIWEAAVLVLISWYAFHALRRQRSLCEVAVRDLEARAHPLSAKRHADPRDGR